MELAFPNCISFLSLGKKLSSRLPLTAVALKQDVLLKGRCTQPVIFSGAKTLSNSIGLRLLVLERFRVSAHVDAKND